MRIDSLLVNSEARETGTDQKPGTVAHACKAQHLGVELGGLETRGQPGGHRVATLSPKGTKLEHRLPVVNVMFLCRDGDSRCPGPGG